MPRQNTFIGSSHPKENGRGDRVAYPERNALNSQPRHQEHRFPHARRFLEHIGKLTHGRRNLKKFFTKIARRQSQLRKTYALNHRYKYKQFINTLGVLILILDIPFERQDECQN